MNPDRAAMWFFLVLAYVSVFRHELAGALVMVAFSILFFALELSNPSAWENVNKRDDDEV